VKHEMILFSVCILVAGMAIGSLLHSHLTTSILRNCAKSQTAEKIGDEFFYIVPEHEYVKASRLRLFLWNNDTRLNELRLLMMKLNAASSACIGGARVPPSETMRSLLDEAWSVADEHMKIIYALKS
jgi:hypothetical protein